MKLNDRVRNIVAEGMMTEEIAGMPLTEKQVKVSKRYEVSAKVITRSS